MGTALRVFQTLPPDEPRRPGQRDAVVEDPRPEPPGSPDPGVGDPAPPDAGEALAAESASASGLTSGAS